MTNNHGRWRRVACAGPLAAALVLGVCLPATGIGETTAVLTITVKTQGGLPPNRAYIHVEQADPAVEPLDWVWMNGKSPDEKTGIVTYTGLHLGWKTRLSLDTFFPGSLRTGWVILTGTHGVTVKYGEGTAFAMPATLSLTLDTGAPPPGTITASAATAAGKAVPVSVLTTTGRPLVAGWDELTQVGDSFSVDVGKYLVGAATWDGYSQNAPSFAGPSGATVASLSRAEPVTVVSGQETRLPPLVASPCASVKGVVKGVKKGRKYQVYVENRVTSGSYTRQAFPKPKKATSSRLSFTVPGVALGKYSVRVQDETKPGGKAAYWKDNSAAHTKLPLSINKCAAKGGVNLTLTSTSKATARTSAEAYGKGRIVLEAYVDGVPKTTGRFRVSFGSWSTTKKMKAKDSSSMVVAVPRALTCADTVIVAFTPSGATAKLASRSLQRLRVWCNHG